MKTCSKCKQEMAIDLFGTDRSKSDGVRPDCKKCQYTACNKAALRERSKRWASANRVKAQQMSKDWALRNPERVKARNQRLYQGSKEIVAARHKAWSEKNRGRLRELQRAWTRRNPAKANAWNAIRRAARVNATPSWADLAAIRAFYEACPAGHHVDHVVPLRGKAVCGLHVLGNLQYLTATENHKKGASYG